MKVSSANLGISGECDVLEFRKSENGISLHGYDGLWQPYPVEYKRGAPAAREGNALQLCAQAMCLECLVDAAQCTMLKHELRSIMDESKDSLRFYHLGNKYQTKVEHFGAKETYEPEGILMI